VSRPADSRPADSRPADSRSADSRPADLRSNDSRPEPLGARELEALLRRKGQRVTRQRRAVYAALAARVDHPTAEELYHEVRRRVPGLSLATVYKNLEALVSAGAASRLLRADGVWRYDVRADEHDHLRCLGCGRVRDLDLPRRPARPADVGDDRFEVTGYRLEVLGYCQSCRPRGRRPRRGHTIDP
jgi:Fe2+ or Zn2+ uptake regulation protein